MDDTYRSMKQMEEHRGEQILIRPPSAAQPSRSAYFGVGLAAAFIVPPPRRRASPTYKKKGWVCSLRLTASLLGLKIYTAK
jgi:hypothetical protein